MHGRHAPATECLPLTIIKQMVEMLLRLGFSQTVAQMLVKDQGIDSLCTLASLSDEDIMVCDIIRRPIGLGSGKTPGKQISILVAKNLKFAALMFKLMEHCSKADDIWHVDIISVLQYQYQWDCNKRKQTRIIRQRKCRTYFYTSILLGEWGEFHWPMWSSTTLRWHTSHLEMMLTWTLRRRWLPEPHCWCKVKPQNDSGILW